MQPALFKCLTTQITVYHTAIPTSAFHLFSDNRACLFLSYCAAPTPPSPLPHLDPTSKATLSVPPSLWTGPTPPRVTVPPISPHQRQPWAASFPACSPTTGARGRTAKCSRRSPAPRRPSTCPSTRPRRRSRPAGGPTSPPSRSSTASAPSRPRSRRTWLLGRCCPPRRGRRSSARRGSWRRCRLRCNGRC